MGDETRPDFAPLYAAFHDKVVAYAAKYVGADAAEDVAQDVFVKIGRSLETLHDPAKLTSWVYAIAHNTIQDALRKRSVRVERPTGDGPRASWNGQLDAPDPAARTPEELAIRDEMVACYLRYLERLPRHYREVYVLSEFEHLSNEAIARRLSLSLGTVKIRLHRARTKLHEQLRCGCRPYYNERGELMGEPRPASADPSPVHQPPPAR